MFTNPPRVPALAIVVQALTPYVGPTMAGASVRGICERLGLDPATLHGNQLEKLLQALEPGLDVYVGKEKARRVVSEVRAAVAALGGSR